jgi:hypothetical protein
MAENNKPGEKTEGRLLEKPLAVAGDLDQASQAELEMMETLAAMLWIDDSEGPLIAHLYGDHLFVTDAAKRRRK